MQVILTKEVLGLGDPGEMVTVKRGYARNYLIPKGFALEATKKNMNALEAERTRILASQANEAEKVRSEAEGLSGVSVTLQVRAGETGKLYGSVATKDIAAALAELGHEIDRRRILLDQPIKDLGEHPTRVKLHPQVVVEIMVKVEALAPEKDETQQAAQAKAEPVAEETEPEAEAAAEEAAEEAEEPEEQE